MKNRSLLSQFSACLLLFAIYQPVTTLTDSPATVISGTEIADGVKKCRNLGGNWNDPTTWLPTGVPSINDSVYVAPADRLVIPGDFIAKIKGLLLEGELTINFGGRLSIAGAAHTGIHIRTASGLLINQGQILVGEILPVVRAISISNGAEIRNLEEAEIRINNFTGGKAIELSTNSRFQNAGKLTIGSIDLQNNMGIYHAGADFTNTTSGSIKVNTRKGILLSGVSVFTNEGEIEFGTEPGKVAIGIGLTTSTSRFVNAAGSVLHFRHLVALPPAGTAAIQSDSLNFTNMGTINLAMEGGESIVEGFGPMYPNVRGVTNNTGTINFGNISNFGIKQNAVISNNNNGVLNCHGEVAVFGEIRNNTGGLVTILPSAQLKIRNKFTNNNSALLHNQEGGIIQLNGLGNTIARLVNLGEINNEGTCQLISIVGPSIINQRIFHNRGVLELSSTNLIFENKSPGVLYNYGVLKGRGTLKNTGTIKNLPEAFTKPGNQMKIEGFFEFRSSTFQAQNGCLLTVSGQVDITNAKLVVNFTGSPNNGTQFLALESTLSITGQFSSVLPEGWFANYNKPTAGKLTLSFGAPLP